MIKPQNRKKKPTILGRFLKWRIRHVNSRNFMLMMSVLVGLSVGFAAVIIKNLVHLIQSLLTGGFSAEDYNILFSIYPALGIALAVVFINILIKKRVGHGIPTILHAISSTNGDISRHNMFSSVVASALTVGFGGSVGLEGPTVATGGAIGANLGKLFHLSYRQIILLIGCAAAGAMSAIFKAPIAAIVFVIEVIMLDLTMSSMVPLLLSSVSAALTSYLFLGQGVIYQFSLTDTFHLNEVPLFIGLGVFTGLVSVYFTRVYVKVGGVFDKFKKPWVKLAIGGLSLGVLIFLFPSLYGEGYEAINGGLASNFTYLFEKSIFYGIWERSNLSSDAIIVIVMVAAVLILKVLATSITFGAGGIGGIFAPSLFTGMNAGILFALIHNQIFNQDISITSFALVGMGGMIAGVLHAPLTAIFLIAELTMAYELFMPLMITATISYATIKYFEPNSVYHIQLVKRKQLFTHDKDKIVLALMRVDKLIERNFSTIRLDASLGDLVKVIAHSNRNIYPVIDDEDNFYGMVILENIREVMFITDKYETSYVRNLMVKPQLTIYPGESMDSVVQKFHRSGKFNIPVLKEGKYIGFVSRARVFSSYRQMLRQWSED
ncbi:MAG: chloride channel protein [Bacteroidetes bacterium]|jgi:chloride channel protein, CIC family|nr:chloride channel protein [Bacteroidota bacterium]MBT3747577.1 chloride channel protein [Bacteroidota bacterium]MBT4399822.1 chloride channel protein [Bacteroidota bacterium]MBT4410275.1 chloride channel protein [Bacteroidota bacterium]MBT7464883.1 chloride channel protein [Bacteroidota bacterium]